MFLLLIILLNADLLLVSLLKLSDGALFGELIWLLFAFATADMGDEDESGFLLLATSMSKSSLSLLLFVVELVVVELVVDESVLAAAAAAATAMVALGILKLLALKLEPRPRPSVRAAMADGGVLDDLSDVSLFKNESPPLPDC